MQHINDYHIKINIHYHRPYDRKDTAPLDKALLKFSKKIKDIALLPEMQEREYFTSKSESKRNKKRIGKYRHRNAALKIK